MASTTPVYRLYNPNSGQLFFTNDFNESNYLMNLGWNYEGEAFKFNYPYQWEGKITPL
ncbi:hypothetical protein [Lactococcus cremoris]|uniref:hypothetical protein n=1 Tax=Lactococcus lactis subsp. cremoris TaxID=1359 RepID=UPI002152B9D7